MSTTLLRLIALIGLVIPTVAFAHTGVGDAHSLIQGFMHPLSGTDHVLAMVGVGLFAAHLGGRALWLVPASFVIAMTGAGAFRGQQQPVNIGEQL